MMAVLLFFVRGLHAGEQADFRAVYAVPSAAFHAMPGRQGLHGGQGVALALGYDINEPLTVEASAGYASLERRRDRARTAFMPLALDGIYHFAHWDRFDPVLLLGAGYNMSDRRVFRGERGAFAVRAGGGFFYTLNETFSVRGTVAVYRPRDKAALSVTASAGLVIYLWSAE